jgi:hypothetical protein
MWQFRLYVRAMSTIQRLPGVIAAIRRDYETLGHSIRLLSRRYGLPASTIALNAKTHGWVKGHPAPVCPSGILSGATGARDVETAILAQGLRRQPYRSERMPPNPATRQLTEPGVPANALAGDLLSSAQKSAEPAADLPPTDAQAKSDGPTCVRTRLLYRPETKSLTEAAGRSGGAGVKLHRQEALCLECKGLGDEVRGVVCAGPLRGSD